MLPAAKRAPCALFDACLVDADQPGPWYEFRTVGSAVFGREGSPLKVCSELTTGPPNQPLCPARADATGFGAGNDVCGGDMGREKLIEDLCAGSSSSTTLDRFVVRDGPRPDCAALEVPRSRLTPRPPPLPAGEPPRAGGSMLELRR